MSNVHLVRLTTDEQLDQHRTEIRGLLRAVELTAETLMLADNENDVVRHTVHLGVLDSRLQAALRALAIAKTAAMEGLE